MLHRVKSVSNYFLFKFEPACNLHLVIPKLLMECRVKYLSSDRPKPGEARKGTKLLVKIVKIRARVHGGCNLFLSAIGKSG